MSTERRRARAGIAVVPGVACVGMADELMSKLDDLDATVWTDADEWFDLMRRAGLLHGTRVQAMWNRRHMYVDNYPVELGYTVIGQPRISSAALRDFTASIWADKNPAIRAKLRSAGYHFV